MKLPSGVMGLQEFVPTRSDEQRRIETLTEDAVKPNYKEGL